MLHVMHNNASIARTVVARGHNLWPDGDFRRVETPEQRAFLVARGCEFFQRFLFSQALPIAAFDSYVQDSITRCANARPWAA